MAFVPVENLALEYSFASCAVYCAFCPLKQVRNLNNYLMVISQQYCFLQALCKPTQTQDLSLNKDYRLLTRNN